MGWRLPPHLLLYHQEHTGATRDRLLHRSLTHTFRGTFPQPFYVTYRRRAESFWYSRLKYEAFATPLVIPLIVEYASGADVVKFCDCVGGERDFRCGDIFAEVCDR
jgi:hypothetical protein